MTDEIRPISDLAPPARRPRRRPRRALIASGVIAGLSALVIGAGVFVVGFAHGPVPVDWVRDRLAASLAEKVGEGARVGLDGAKVARVDGETRLVLSGFSLEGPDGRRVIGAPSAVVSFDPWSAAMGGFNPSRIDLVGVEMRIRLDEQGRATILQGDSPRTTASVPPSAVVAPLASTGAVESAEREDWRKTAAALVDALVSPDGSLARFDRFGLKDGRLLVEDHLGRRRAGFDDVAVHLAPGNDGGRVLEMSGRGRAGTWRAVLEARRDAAGERRVMLSTAGATLGDVAMALGITAPFGADTVVKAEALLTLAPDLGRATLGGKLDIGRLVVPRFDPDMGPIPIDGIVADWSFDETTGRVVVGEIVGSSGPTTISAGGVVALDDKGRAIVSIDRGEGRFDPAAKGFDPVRVGAFSGVAAIAANGRIEVERFSFTGDATGSLRGMLHLGEAGEGIKLKLEARGISRSAAFRLWPPITAAPVRSYLLARLERGKLDEIAVDLDMTVADLEAATQRRPVPDRSVAVTFSGHEGRMRLLDGMPIVSFDQFRGRVTGRTVSLEFPAGQTRLPSGARIAFSEGEFEVADVTASPHPVARVGLRAQGPAAGVVELLASDAFKTQVGPMPIDIGKGNADLTARLSVPIAPLSVATEVPITAQGTLSGLTIEKAFAGEALGDGQFQMRIERGQLSLKGDGKLMGLAVGIDLKKPLRGTGGEVLVTTTIDDQARAKRGLATAGLITGAVGTRITVPLSGKDVRPRVEFDVGKARIEGMVPGWSKDAGKPGRIAFLLGQPKGGGFELADFAAEAAGLVLKGAVTLDKDMQFRAAKFSQAKLSPGDEGRVEVERQGQSMKAVVRANVVDARPFLKMLTNPGGREGKSNDGELEIDLKSQIVTGHHAEALSNVELRMSRVGQETKAFQLSARLGAAPVAGNIARRSDGVNVIMFQSADAGAVLRFADLYQRMVGGSLLLQTTTVSGRQEGLVTIRDFGLRNEPAVKRILAEPPPGAVRAESDRSTAAPPRPSGDGTVAFQRMRANFTRRPGRVDLREAVIWGPQIGADVEGFIDFARNRIALTGTFVPAYALNNAFAQVPVVGFLLSGGQHGGLFAVNFKVSGSLAEPQLAVNPLSAIAPGFLRKFFEFSRTQDLDADFKVPPSRSVETR